MNIIHFDNGKMLNFRHFHGVFVLLFVVFYKLWNRIVIKDDSLFSRVNNMHRSECETEKIFTKKKHLAMLLINIIFGFQLVFLVLFRTVVALLQTLLGISTGFFRIRLGSSYLQPDAFHRL